METNREFLLMVFDNLNDILKNEEIYLKLEPETNEIVLIKYLVDHLYMVFYYSDKSIFSLGEGCTPLINNTNIENNQKMMNYIFTDINNNKKLYLLSSKGFDTYHFEKLKGFLDEFKNISQNNDSEYIIFLNNKCNLWDDFKEYKSLEPILGGRNNKKSNKRQNKQPRKNKSLKRKN